MTDFNYRTSFYPEFRCSGDILYVLPDLIRKDCMYPEYGAVNLDFQSTLLFTVKILQTSAQDDSVERHSLYKYTTGQETISESLQPC